MAFDAAEKNGKFGRIQCQKSKEKETSIPLQMDSESQSHPSELSENWRMGDARWGERPERGTIEESVGDQNPGHEAPLRSKRGR